MDVDKLLKALDKDENEELINTTSEQINNNNRSVVEELELENDEQELYLEKLEGYKYVDDISSLKSGAYIRWLCISNPANIKLSKVR